jgi:predicted lipid-binding transport protein (Tim44 family)
MVDVTTIIFAILAIFVVWKLRSVLGTRTGAERPPRDPFNRAARGELKPEPAPYNKEPIRLPGGAAEPPAAEAPEPAVDRWAGVAEPGSKAAAGLDAIAQAQPSFDAKAFLEGAKGAYEMIVTAFAAGDRATLRNLLAKDVFDSFQQAIADRETRGEKVETTFVSIDKATIEDAALRGDTAQIAVKFQSKLITATRDKAGVIIDGNAERVVDMIDIWTFARDVSARDPNWKLVATDSGH